MTNASAHQDSHSTKGHAPNEAAAHLTVEHADSDLHSGVSSSAEKADPTSNGDCEHVGDKCCSSFCSSAMIISTFNDDSNTYGDDFAARPLKALLSGEWVVPHRPPNT